MPSLPQDIQVEILLRLPVKSILRFKSVCKSWCTYITSLKFVNDHLILTNKNLENTRIMIRDDKYMVYSVDYDSVLTASASSSSTTCKCDGAVLMDYPTMKESNGVESRFNKILGSCNGLVCMGDSNSDTLILWNPSTKEYKEFLLPADNLRLASYGFGFDSENNDYKFVCTVRYEVYVWTLKSNSWRKVDNIPYKCLSEWGGLLLNGALHWTGVAANEINRDIVAFDISSEKFLSFPIPKGNFCVLQVLANSLCLVCGVANDHLDIWVMQNYGVIESWTMKFTITQERITRYPNSLYLCWSFKDGKIVIQGLAGIILYDQPNDMIRFLKINGIRKFGYHESWSYVESLVSLNSGTYMGERLQILPQVRKKFKNMKV